VGEALVEFIAQRAREAGDFTVAGHNFIIRLRFLDCHCALY
jgi:hypothetical protein